MKIHNYKYVFLLALFVISCQNDDDSIARKGKPSISIAEKTITVTEGETATFNLKVEYAVENPINIRIDVLDSEGNPLIVVLPSGEVNSGNGFYDLVVLDNIMVPYNTWFESGYFQYGYTGGSGYIANFPAGETDLEINIETIENTLENNATTVNLRLTSTNLLEATIDEVVSINIEDSN